MTTVFGNITSGAKFNSPSRSSSVLHVEESLGNDEEGFSLKLNKVEPKSCKIVVSDVGDQNSQIETFDDFLATHRKILP